jgi:hypothetical protein
MNREGLTKVLCSIWQWLIQVSITESNIIKSRIFFIAETWVSKRANNNGQGLHLHPPAHSILHLKNFIGKVFIWPTSSVIHKMQKMQGISSKLSSIQTNIPNSVMYTACSFISQTMDNIVSQLPKLNILTPDRHNPEGKQTLAPTSCLKTQIHWDKCCNFCCNFVEKQRLFCMPFFCWTATWK